MRSPFIHFLIALAIGVLVLIGYGACYSGVSNKSKEVADLESQIDAATKNVSRIVSARSALAEIAIDEERMHKYFVPEADIATFINVLQARGIAQKTVVSVLSVSMGGSPAQPSLLLTLTVQGTFDAVMRTVGSIEYAPYAISISALSLEKSAKDSWQANLKIIVGAMPITEISSKSTP
ncbi:MAG: hypothetical protein WAW90_03095 [Minisyncoccia bacterium]